LGLVCATLQIVHSLIEERPDSRPAELNNENQDRQRDGRENQYRFDTDLPSLVIMHLPKKIA
jgi:hypothetical protein